MCRKLFCLMFVVLVFVASQVVAAQMGQDGFADRIVVRDDGSGNALWLADTSSDPNTGIIGEGFGDGAPDVMGVYGLMSDIAHLLGDVNGDGLMDRVRVWDSLGTWWWDVDYSTPAGFGDAITDTGWGFGGTIMLPVAMADMNGDGIAQSVLIYRDQGGNVLNWWYQGGPLMGVGFGGPNMNPMIYDINGDGIPDRIVDIAGGTSSPTFTSDIGTLPGAPPVDHYWGDGAVDWGGAGGSSYGGTGMLPFVTDINGDGYGDRVVAMLNTSSTPSVYDWHSDLSMSTDWGDSTTDVVSVQSFGQEGDVLLLSDVLLDCQPPLGDINADCEVNINDIAIMANQWMQAPGSPSADIAVPADNIVNLLDFAILASYYLDDTTGL